MEIWRVIPSATDYEASNYGNIRRLSGGAGAIEGHILRAQKNRQGYWQVVVRVNRKSIMRSVHVLVAEAWIGTRPNGHDIHHVNRNKNDNSEWNLDYHTKEEHRKRHLTVTRVG